MVALPQTSKHGHRLRSQFSRLSRHTTPTTTTSTMIATTTNAFPSICRCRLCNIGAAMTHVIAKKKKKKKGGLKE